jgi:hypothetical protein
MNDGLLKMKSEYWTIDELIDKAKKEMPTMKYIPPFVIQDGELSKKQAKELDEYLRADFAWKFRWFGEGKYIE